VNTSVIAPLDAPGHNPSLVQRIGPAVF